MTGMETEFYTVFNIVSEMSNHYYALRSSIPTSDPRFADVTY